MANSIEVSDIKQSDDDPNRATIVVDLAEWREFQSITASNPRGPGTSAIRMMYTEDLGVKLVSASGVILNFDRDEWDAFVAGVRAGEFAEEAMLASV